MHFATRSALMTFAHKHEVPGMFRIAHVDRITCDVLALELEEFHLHVPSSTIHPAISQIGRSSATLDRQAAINQTVWEQSIADCVQTIDIDGMAFALQCVQGREQGRMACSIPSDEEQSGLTQSPPMAMGRAMFAFDMEWTMKMRTRRTMPSCR
jgi:hypothetical protein